MDALLIAVSVTLFIIGCGMMLLLFTFSSRSAGGSHDEGGGALVAPRVPQVREEAPSLDANASGS